MSKFQAFEGENQNFSFFIFQFPLIQCSAIPGQANGQGNDKENRDRPQVRKDLMDGVALEQYAPDDAQKMGERQHIAYVLRPDGHTPEREHEAGKQD